MSPGFPPAAASTLPAGFRFGKPAAGVEITQVVELAGIEPATSALQRRRSPS